MLTFFSSASYEDVEIQFYSTMLDWRKALGILKGKKIEHNYSCLKLSKILRKEGDNGALTAVYACLPSFKSLHWLIR